MTQDDSKKKQYDSNSRSYNWAFTTNNYTKEDIDNFLTHFTRSKLYIFQQEKGEKGTPHLQGTVGYKSQRTFSSMCKIHPGSHWTKCKNLGNSIRYCNKEDTRDGQQWKLNVDKYLMVNKPSSRYTAVPDNNHLKEMKIKWGQNLRKFGLGIYG